MRQLLHTDDFWRDYAAFQSCGVAFLETLRQEVYGTVAIFVELYGNKWNLLHWHWKFGDIYYLRGYLGGSAARTFRIT